MAITLSITEDMVLTALRTFLLSVLPAGVEVVQGQNNRTPEPAANDYIVMTPIIRLRTATSLTFSSPSGRRFPAQRNSWRSWPTMASASTGSMPLPRKGLTPLTGVKV